MCSSALSNGASTPRRLASRPRSSSTTCTNAARSASRCGEHAEPAADLEHHVIADELGQPLDDVEDVAVDEEVLTELAPPDHHQPKRAAALTDSSNSS